jgi:alpha-ketoglutarate-dependent taurine dioxygenase
MRAVTKAIDPNLLDRLQRRGVRYVRHYRPHADLPWQVVFQTKDPAEVARYCESHDIEYSWLPDGTLYTSQVCQGTAVHPATGETLFFNQAHLFHVSNLDPDAATALIDLFGYDRLPRNALYGDRVEFDEHELTSIREAFASTSVRFSWRRGDVLLLDNMLTAHGRRSYSGPRKILVSLFDPFSPEHSAA